MRIKFTTLYVDDQDRALAFYTEKLGFQKKTDVGGAGYRWLTVVAPDDPDGVELQLAPNSNPAAKAFQEAQFGQGAAAMQFLVDDTASEVTRLKNAGVKFTMEATEVTGSVIAMLDDTCGNLIQLTHLTWGG